VVLRRLSDELSNITTEAAQGGVVSLTLFSMSYLTRMSKYYKDILTELIVSKPAPTRIGVSELEDAQLASQTPLQLHVVYIVVLLRFKIDKCKLYCKPGSAKSYLFLADNLAHIVQHIGKCPTLKDMVSNIPYMNKLREDDLKQTVIKYQRKSCDDMLRCLRNNSAVRCFPGVQLSRAATFKRRIESFYAMFEEALLNQARWVKLVKELRPGEEQSVPVEEVLVVTYTKFLDRFKYKGDQNVIDHHVKYSPDQIRAMISTNFVKYNPTT
jgi:exocyst complex protein 7